MQPAPELRGDLVRLGGLLEIEGDHFQAGVPTGAPIDTNRQMIAKGRRELAVQLLALMGVTDDDLKSMMEVNDDDY